jgi:hypothetical protein
MCVEVWGLGINRKREVGVDGERQEKEGRTRQPIARKQNWREWGSWRGGVEWRRGAESWRERENLEKKVKKSCVLCAYFSDE